MLAEQLAALGADVTAAGSPVMGHLGPGLPAKEVRERLLGARLGTHPDLVTWFEWRNGVHQTPPTTKSQASLIAAWMPFSLDRAIDEANRAAIDSSPWEPSWLPIARHAWRRLSSIVVDSSAGEVYRWDGEDGEAGSIGSVERLVAGWRRALSAGLYWDEDDDAWSVPEGVVLPRDVTDERLL
jgi:hypothetical protein